MWASKIGSWAAAGVAPIPSTAAMTSRTRRLMPRILPSSGRRLAPPARPIADADGVGDRREHDAVRLADALLVWAAAAADDPRRRAAHQCRRRPLEREQSRLERAAEGV